MRDGCLRARSEEVLVHTYADDRGYSLMSLWDHLPDIPGQVNVSCMYAGAVKAWHRHHRQDDHWAVLRGALKIGLFNSGETPVSAELRLAGATPGHDTTVPVPVAPGSGRAVHLSEHRPGVLRIPAGLWHGGVAIGGQDALLLYYVTQKYNAQQPDEERTEWNHFPFSWLPEFR